LWIVEVNFVVWIRLEVVADFKFGVRLMFIWTFHKIFSGLADVKRNVRKGRNVRNKLFSAVFAVVFMIKTFTSSQFYRMPNTKNITYFFSSSNVTTLYFNNFPRTLRNISVAPQVVCVLPSSC